LLEQHKTGTKYSLADTNLHKFLQTAHKQEELTLERLKDTSVSSDGLSPISYKALKQRWNIAHPVQSEQPGRRNGEYAVKMHQRPIISPISNPIQPNGPVRPINEESFANEYDSESTGQINASFLEAHRSVDILAQSSVGQSSIAQSSIDNQNQGHR
jgi:hypothetical protein